MLDEGAAGKAALALADEVEFLGAQLTTGASFDASVVRLIDAGGEAGRGAGLLADVAFAPDFPADELERLRTERLTGAAAGPRRSAVAGRDRLPAAALRPEHRYGTAAGGTEASLKALGVDELRDVPSRPLSARQRGAHRRRRRDARRRCGRSLDQRFGTWKAAGAGRAALSDAGRAAARQAPDLHRRQAGRRAVADPHRAGRRAALDARLHRPRRVEHDSRRLVHLAPQHTTCARRTATPTARRRVSTCDARPGRSRPAPACRPTRPPRR